MLSDQLTQLMLTAHKIQKRPLLHPAIAPARSGSSVAKIVYVSASTSFIVIIKRVQKLLGHVEERLNPRVRSGASETQLAAAVDEAARRRSMGDGEEVIIKGTGKAVEMVLRVGLWWQSQEGVHVAVRTSSVGAVDDIVRDEEIEASRVRRLSCLEVSVRMS